MMLTILFLCATKLGLRTADHSPLASVDPRLGVHMERWFLLVFIPMIKGEQDKQRGKQEVRESELYEEAARAHVVAMLLKRSTYSLRVSL